MQTNINLVNSSQAEVNNGEEVFLRSIPASIKLNELTPEALRLLVYYVSKQGPYDLAIESGYFKGSLAQWLQSLKANFTLKATVRYYHELTQLTGLSEGDMVFVEETDLVYFYSGSTFPAKEKGMRLTGASAYQIALEQGFVGTPDEWLASLKGEPFRFEDFTSEQLDLITGPTGLSAYDLAVEQGFKGNLTQWLDYLVGPKGDKGDKGDTGINGKSAYQLAVDNGYQGTSDAWLASLKGVQGDRGFSAYDIALQDGYVGSPSQWLLSLEGDSAYEIAVSEGYQGTKTDWLESLRARTPYELAVQNGFQGSETSWLNSLKGKSAYELAVATGYAGTQDQWLEYIKGRTAYQLAVQNGYQGTEEQWLNSLRGKSAYGVAVDNGYQGSQEEWLQSLKGASAYTLAVANGYQGSMTSWLESLKGTKGIDGKSIYELAVDAGYVGTLEDWLAQEADLKEFARIAQEQSELSVNAVEQATTLIENATTTIQTTADNILSGVDVRLAAASGGKFGFNTLAEFEVAKADLPETAIVTIAEAGSNQGDNIWDGETLTPSPYDPYQKAVDYFERSPMGSPVTITSGTDIGTLGNGYWVITSDSLAETLTGLPPQLTQPRRGFIFTMAKGTTSYQKFVRDFSSNVESYERTGNGKPWGSEEHAWLDWKVEGSFTKTDILNTVNNNPNVKAQTLTGTEILTDLPEGRYFIKTSAIATALDDQLPPTATNPKLGWIDVVHEGNSMFELRFTRYTRNSGTHEYENFTRRSLGGSSALTLADWTKDVSRKEFDKMALETIPALQDSVDKSISMNFFKNTSLTAVGATTYQATNVVEEGENVAYLNQGGVTAIFYDYVVDNKIFVPGQKITFTVEGFCDLATNGQGIDISIIAYKEASVQTGTTVTSQNKNVNEWESLLVSMVLPEDAVSFRLRLIRRLGNVVGKFRRPSLTSSSQAASTLNFYELGSGSSSSSLHNVFVSKAGVPGNSGTVNSPFRTIQEAVNALVAANSNGVITILDDEWYRETVSNSSDLTITIQGARGKRASIVGSNTLNVTKTSSYNKVYQATLSTKPIGMGGARGKPLIIEWGTPSSEVLAEDVHHLQRGVTHRLPYTPMFEATSKDELDTVEGNGKWWWEDGVIYFSATDGSDATQKQYEARSRACLNITAGSIILKRINSLFSNSYGMSFNCVSVHREDCRVYGAYHNGFSDNANSTVSIRDMSLQCGNDGFNGTVSTYENLSDASTSINATYFDPYGALNGDDGISYHIRGTCNIYGGLFEYNTKAGVVHVTGGGGNCYNTISRGQINGFYTATVSPDGRVKSSMHCHNTIAEKNQYDYRAADDAELYCIGTYSKNPTGFGYYQSGTGAIFTKDAKYLGESTKKKSGNIVSETYESV